MSVHLTRFLAVAVTIGLTGAAAGCAGSPEETPGGSALATASPGESPQERSGAQAVLDETLDLEVKVRELIIRLTEACLRDKGVDRFPRRHAPPRDNATTGPRTSPTLEAAQTKGYGITDGPGPDTPAEPPFKFASDAEERRYMEALTGSSDGNPSTGEDGKPVLGGCTGEARRAVYGEVAAPEPPVLAVRELAEAEYAKDATVKASVKDWSRCLEKAGYPELKGPEDAARYAQYFHYPAGTRPGGAVPAGGPWPAAVAKQKEIALAVADARCADETGLRTDQQRVWAKVLGGALSRHETRVFGYRDALTAALKRGQQALQS